MKLTAREKRYLENKKRGGFINQRGNTYESYFTLYHILRNTNKYLASLSSVAYSAQEDAFIDDLFVRENSDRFLYQLKTSKDLNWGSGKIKTLQFDFVKQKRIETDNKTTFELGLVVSYRNLRKKMFQKLPTALKSCTKILFFPYHLSINKQISNYKNFRDELVSLISFNNPSHDKLESLAACILGSWEASTKKNVLLSDIIKLVENIPYSFIRSAVVHTLSIPFKTILDKIPHFMYIVSHGYVTWSYKSTDTGTIFYKIGSIEFTQIENAVIAANPTDFTTLEPLIS